jgi:hypothetical protein
MISIQNIINKCLNEKIYLTNYVSEIHKHEYLSVVNIMDDSGFTNAYEYPNKKFFCRNVIEKDNLTCIPIGISTESENNILNTNHQEKSILCSSQYSNLTRSVNLSGLDFVTYFPKQSNEEYLHNISKSKYVLSPHGFNPDCFRHWESMYLSAIPITLNHPKLNSFKDLPILFLDSWDELSEELLNERYEEILNMSREKLDINYWIDLMKSSE